MLVGLHIVSGSPKAKLEGWMEWSEAERNPFERSGLAATTE